MILPSYSNFNCLYCHQPAIIHTSSSSPKSQRSRYLRRGKPPFRCFVNTPSNTSQAPSPKDPPWPDPFSPNAVPTPYQIFGLKKGSPYSKRRFYELVKIYHPDRNGFESESSNTESLPRSIKTERYRLIVTAHEILSDSVKRSAYDTSGAGWDGRPDHGAPEHAWGRNNGAKWSDFDANDSPFRNATWEDWERWYQRDKAKQEPVYFTNGGFLMIVLTTVFLAGFGQSTRAGDYSNVFQQQVEKAHDNASTAIRQCRTDSRELGNKDERLQNFLRSRGSHGYEATNLTEENYGNQTARDHSRDPNS